MKSQLWWYTARAGGIVAWALLAVTVVWGLLLSSRLLGRRISGPKLLDLHRYLGGLAVVFTGVHLVGLVLDSFVDFGIVDLLVPMASSHEPGAVAWGVVAMYLLVAVEITSLLRRRVGERVWRSVHYLSFGTFAAGTVHALVLPGTDIENPAIWWPSAVAAAAVVGLAVARVVANGNPMRRATTDADTVALDREVARRERAITEQLRGDGERPDAALIERTLLGLRALDDRVVSPADARGVPADGPSGPVGWTMPPAPPARPGSAPVVAPADLAPGRVGPEGAFVIPPPVLSRPAPEPVAPIFADPIPRFATDPVANRGITPTPPEAVIDAAPFVAPSFDVPVPPAFTESVAPTDSPLPSSPAAPATSGSPHGRPRDLSLSWLAPEAVSPADPPVEARDAPGPDAPAPRLDVPSWSDPVIDARPLPTRELPVRTPRRLARTTAAAERLDAWTPTRRTATATVPAAPPAPPDAVDPVTGEPDPVAYRKWLKDWLAYVESHA